MPLGVLRRRGSQVLRPAWKLGLLEAVNKCWGEVSPQVSQHSDWLAGLAGWLVRWLTGWLVDHWSCTVRNNPLSMDRFSFSSQTSGIRKDVETMMETPWWGSGVKPPEKLTEAKLQLERQNELIIPDVVRSVTQGYQEAMDNLKETLTYDVWCVRPQRHVASFAQREGREFPIPSFSSHGLVRRLTCRIDATDQGHTCLQGDGRQ